MSAVIRHSPPLGRNWLRERGESRMRAMGVSEWSYLYDDCESDEVFASLATGNGGSAAELSSLRGGWVRASTGGTDQAGRGTPYRGRILADQSSDKFWVAFRARFSWTSESGSGNELLQVGVLSGGSGKLLVGWRPGTSNANFVVHNQTAGGTNTYSDTGIAIAEDTDYEIEIWSDGTDAYVAVDNGAPYTVAGGPDANNNGYIAWTAENNTSGDTVTRNLDVDVCSAMVERT